MSVFISFICDLLKFIIIVYSLHYGWNATLVLLGIMEISVTHALLIWIFMTNFVFFPLNQHVTMAKFTDAEKETSEAEIGILFGYAFVFGLYALSVYLFGANI